MDTYKGMPYCGVMLLNDDRTLGLSIGFLGFSYEAVEEYMTKKFIECKMPYVKKWTQMKYTTADDAEEQEGEQQ